MKKLILAAAAVCLALGFTACSDDDDTGKKIIDILTENCPASSFITETDNMNKVVTDAGENCADIIAKFTEYTVTNSDALKQSFTDYSSVADYSTVGDGICSASTTFKLANTYKTFNAMYKKVTDCKSQLAGDDTQSETVTNLDNALSKLGTGFERAVEDAAKEVAKPATDGDKQQETDN